MIIVDRRRTHRAIVNNSVTNRGHDNKIKHSKRYIREYVLVKKDKLNDALIEEMADLLEVSDELSADEIRSAIAEIVDMASVNEISFDHLRSMFTAEEIDELEEIFHFIERMRFQNAIRGQSPISKEKNLRRYVISLNRFNYWLDQFSPEQKAAVIRTLEAFHYNLGLALMDDDNTIYVKKDDAIIDKITRDDFIALFQNPSLREMSPEQAEFFSKGWVEVNGKVYVEEDDATLDPAKLSLI